MVAKQNQLEIKKGGYDLSAPVEMISMATVLKNHVVKQKLYSPIQGKNYVHVEGWQFAGGLMGTFPRVVSVENLSTDTEKKWRADVEIVRLKDGDVVSRGFAVCSSKESKKAKFDEYAILSMAQTRAIGKAYRNVIGWVMKAAGYEGTPSEEMTSVGDTPREATAKAEKEEEVAAEEHYTCHGATKGGCGADLTKQEHDYSKKIYGKPLCREHQKGATRLKK